MTQSVVLLKKVTMTYGAHHVLEGIDLAIDEGQIVGYIGPNGAGKSTTVRIMLGLQEGYGGEVLLFGQDIRRASIDYKKRIGYVPETAELYDTLTAREYLLFTGRCYGMETERVEQKIELLLGLWGLSAAPYARISSYSKGMRQKVLITSSLLHNPDLIFFDEPLSGLDANSVLVFKEIMARLAQAGKTIFYSSHIMDVVEKISDRIILLDDGKVAADGSFAELQAQNTEGSLEKIFNQLTGFNQHEKIADDFVTIIEGG